MAKINSFPNNSETRVGAQWMMRYFHGRTSGVFEGLENAKVKANGSDMSITVSDGKGWLSNSEGDGIAWWINNQEESGKPLTLQVEMAESSLNRIDRVIATWETTDYKKLPDVVILKGTPALDPVPPALVNNKLKRQISFAQIIVNAGTVAISQAMIKDERLDKSVCGQVSYDFDIDTDTLQRKFDEWIKGLEDTLDGNTALNLKFQIDKKVDKVEGETLTPNKFTDEDISKINNIQQSCNTLTDNFNSFTESVKQIKSLTFDEFSSLSQKDNSTLYLIKEV